MCDLKIVGVLPGVRVDVGDSIHGSGVLHLKGKALSLDTFSNESRGHP